MGLLFKLNVDERRSTSDELVLRSTYRKMAMGGTLVFGGVFLGIMTLAAAPLFKLYWNEGLFWDRAIVVFFATALVLYPLFAAFCFNFEELVSIKKKKNKSFQISRFQRILFFKWGKKKLEDLSLTKNLVIENCKGTVNVAALKAAQEKRKDRYATRGHWHLKAEKDSESLIIERRPKPEEIEWIEHLVLNHFNLDRKTSPKNDSDDTQVRPSTSP